MNKEKARELRKNLTKSEQVLWQHLRLRQVFGYKFRRQQPIGHFIVDFVCLEKRLIIELDGGHHDQPQQTGYDTNRDNWLKDQGFRIVRFWNNQIFNEMDGVKNVILEALDVIPPPP